MATLTESDLDRFVGNNYTTAKFSESMKKSVDRETRDKANQQYDIFLSHSSLDRKIILQINYLLEEVLGFSVFVDWIEMPEMDRGKVTPATAAVLRDVMGRCKTLAYAYSVNASKSSWMPWELGYSDAKHGRVAVFPVQPYITPAYSISQGQEFVGIYPFLQWAALASDPTRYTFWVHDPVNPNKRYSPLKYWVEGWGLIDRP